MSHPNQGSLFRSEEMTLLQFYIPYEIAQVTVAELGELGCVEFRDVRLLLFIILFFGLLFDD